MKPNYGKKAKPCYMDTYGFIVYIKQIIFPKILQKMLKIPQIWHFKLGIRIPFQKIKIKKVTGSMKMN